MGIFSRKKSKIKDTAENTISWQDFMTLIDSTVKKNAERNLSGVYACIELISNTISKLPFFKIQDNTKEAVDDQRMYNLLNLQPNPNMSASVFKKAIVTNLLTQGNAFVEPVRKFRSSEIARLDILNNVSVLKNPNTGDVMYAVTDDDGKQRELRYDEIVHIKVNPTQDGLMGVSPLTYARLTTSVGLKQEEFQESFYDNGGRPDGVLKTTADLSSKKQKVTMPNGEVKEISLKEELRKAWNNAQSGTGNRFSVAVLDNGLEYATIPQISPADMDFVNSKASNIEDICRYFNVPPYKLGVGKQTYSNNEQANIEYITNAIVPLVEQIEQELTLKMLTYKEIGSGYVIKCNIEAELRGDSATRAAWYKAMQTIGAYSINEIRKHENLPEIEGGDARLVGANSTPLDFLVKGIGVGINAGGTAVNE